MILPLARATPPTNAAELEEALRGGLTQHGLTPREVTVAGEAWPQVQRLTCDLSGTRLPRDFRLAPAAAAAPSAESTLEVAQLQLFGKPLLLESTPAHLEIEAAAVRLQLQPLAGGGTGLGWQGLASGRLELSIRLQDLEALLLTIGREAARARGADLQEVRLQLHQEGERALRFEARATAKAGFFKAVLTASGRAELDEALTLRLSGLYLQGDGMAANMAAGFIRPYLERYEGQPIPLGQFALSGVRLRGVQLQVRESLTVQAEFASA